MSLTSDTNLAKVLRNSFDFYPRFCRNYYNSVMIAQKCDKGRTYVQ